jgi:hypothetical protein
MKQNRNQNSKHRFTAEAQFELLFRAKIVFLGVLRASR